ncbi:hypothetical protein [Caulobacter sp. FWC26]|uniref:hypothetical protein n=1 Tax=Caulobacter sp. FWC26 TaxID=69665 RepID=UPI000C14E146|nr:hypothetical protein [Caulobacter sp. FWC26]AZS19398.1 hypothetical protein CSW63_01345 [Caulobacter sp. FWC26]
MFLAALMLFVAPTLPAVAQTLSNDCCAETPCHDNVKDAFCPDACIIACQVLVTPDSLLVQTAEISSAPQSAMHSIMPPGQAMAPELPPPR